MMAETGSTAPEPVQGSTPKQDEARSTITKTTITPSPGTVAAREAAEAEAKAARPSWRDRLRQPSRAELAAALEPYEGTSILRFVMATILSVLCLLTVGGAILILLLWQQDRASGVLTSQVDRTWDLFDLLRQIERWVAFAVIPVAIAWIALAVVNVRRATGQRRNPIVAAVSLPIGLAGVWLIRSEIILDGDELAQASGLVLQAIFLAIPLLAMERVAQSAEARHRPLRATFIAAVAFLAQMQFLGGLSTVDQTTGSDEWGELGAYLIIGALIQIIGSLSANEAARSIEEGTEHRYQLRHRFGESVLAASEALAKPAKPAR